MHLHKPRGVFGSLVMVGIVCLSLLVAQGAGAAESGEIDLGKLRRGHPRLILAPETMARLKARRPGDPALDAVMRAIESEARSLLKAKPVEYHLTGRRLLSVSRTVLARVQVLAIAWHSTDDGAFARRAEQEMLTAAAFADWHPEHFLDVAELSAALALGYDWLFPALTPEARRAIRTALVRKGIEPGLDPAARHNSWHKTENNWNQVCWGGLTLAALAVSDDEPAVALQTLRLARAKIGHGLKPYAPDGVYPEGPGYWSYGTTYQVMMIASLETALGTDWGMAEAPGFMKSAGALVQSLGPTGRSFNYADGNEKLALQPALFWFARRTGDTGLLESQRAKLDQAVNSGGKNTESFRFMPLLLPWWPEKFDLHASSRLPLVWQGRGEVPIAVFRSAWDDPQAFYLACKGGSASQNHAHMDAGSFVLESRGVRWAVDLGMQEYNSLESKGIKLWGRDQKSERWTVYRLNNYSHNTLTIDGQLHRVDGHGRIGGIATEGGVSRVSIDLSSVFAGQAARVVRTFVIEPVPHRVRIVDELSGLKPGQKIRWAMMTGAEIEANGATAVLRADQQELRVKIESSTDAGAAFATVSAETPPNTFDAPNPGRRLLTANFVAPANGSLTFEISLVTGK